MTTFNVLSATLGTLRKAKSGCCITPFCRKPPRTHERLCAMCRDRKWRAAHPEHHLWNNLKKSAKRRGVPFTLTLDEFKAFCAKTNYHILVGRDPNAASCDRIRDTEGYHADNIRCLEFGLNSGRPKERNKTVSEELPLGDNSNFYAPAEDPLAT